MNASLLALAVLAVFAPDAFPALFDGSRAAWAYVASGVEACALWALVAVSSSALAVRCISVWGMFEAAQRPICRLAFPMGQPPNLRDGQNLCDAATGLPMSWVSVVAALFLAALVQEIGRAKQG